MKTTRALLLCLVTAGLAGCELLPERFTGKAPEPEVEVDEVGGCYAERPDFDDPACLLQDWIAFGLASQRGDRDWRRQTVESLAGEDAERRLARAVALSWGTRREWDRASELYKADLSAAPARLQPLLRYWLNELEGRRALARQLGESRQARQALEQEKATLADKLDALTDIERNINSRQQTE